MSKTVITFDMPNSCDECCLSFPVEGKEERYLCRGCEKGNSTADFEKRPDYCPLRELPETHMTDARQVGEEWAVFNRGWNACLDVIDKTNEGVN